MDGGNENTINMAQSLDEIDQDQEIEKRAHPENFEFVELEEEEEE